MSGTATPDPRIEAIKYMSGRDSILANLDAADRAAGVIRVRVDDAAVERMVLAHLGAEPGMNGYDPAKVWAALSDGERRKRLECAQAVLEALAHP